MFNVTKGSATLIRGADGRIGVDDNALIRVYSDTGVDAKRLFISSTTC